MRNKLMCLTGLAGLFVANCAIADQQIESDFAFGSGRPHIGQTEVDGVVVELLTTNTEAYGRGGFRDVPNAQPAEILICFDRPIREIELSFSRVLEGETVRGFSAGEPAEVTGDLIETEPGVFSVPTEVGDMGQGTLAWRDVDSYIFQFRIEKPFGALAVDGFSAILADGESPDAPGTAAAPTKGPCAGLRPGSAKGGRL